MNSIRIYNSLNQGRLIIKHYPHVPWECLEPKGSSSPKKNTVYSNLFLFDLVFISMLKANDISALEKYCIIIITYFIIINPDIQAL